MKILLYNFILLIAGYIFLFSSFAEKNPEMRICLNLIAIGCFLQIFINGGFKNDDK